jgi:hypothetical protein
MSFRLRGATLIEVTLTLTLTALIIGVATTLYAFIASRTADSVNRFSTLQSCAFLTKEIGSAVSNAISVTTKSLGTVTALVCEVPADGVDRDQDGTMEIYNPSGTDRLGRETYTSGKRIWFYSANQTGAPGTTGFYWFKAIRSDDATPTISDVDTKWSFWNATVPKVFIPGSVTFAPESSLRLARVRILTSKDVSGSDAGLTRSNRGTELDLNQHFFWRSF